MLSFYCMKVKNMNERMHEWMKGWKNDIPHKNCYHREKDIKIYQTSMMMMMMMMSLSLSLSLSCP